jgi:hypothetical protein
LDLLPHKTLLIYFFHFFHIFPPLPKSPTTINYFYLHFIPLPPNEVIVELFVEPM